MAIGATPRRILTEFFLESLVLTLGSGVVGVAFAVSSVNWSLNSAAADVRRPADHAPDRVRGLLHAGPGGILAAMYPARRASLLTPVEALRYE